jgi:hypothetical protein
MNRRNIFIILVVIILALTISVVFFVFIVLSGSEKKPVETVGQMEEEDRVALQEANNSYNQQFPDVVGGIINIVSDSETAITAKEGKIYLISPARPVSFYKNSGIGNNTPVEIRGKILDNNRLSIGSIIPAK